MNNTVDRYRIVYYFSEEDGCYLATIPELPGCISDGDTIKDAENEGPINRKLLISIRG